MSITRRYWTIKDTNGNVLTTFKGRADSSLIGTMWNGVEVASVEQLPDVIHRTVAEQREQSLEERLVALENRITTLEGRS